MTLRTRKLGLSAGARVLVRNLDLDIAPGEVWAVLGRNGSGKSTLLHALAGLAPAASPVEGEVLLDGVALAGMPRREQGRALGMLLQHESSEYWGTAADYVRLGRYPHASALGADAGGERLLAYALAAFDLESLAARGYQTLSGGERQRARLAQLWAQDTRFLLLDEPLQQLDLLHQKQVFERVRAAAHDHGKAALVVLHDLAWAQHCDRALLLYGDGRWTAGAARDLLEPAALQALYGCSIAECGSGAARHFLVI